MDDSAATGQEGSDNPDWHPADVQAALKKFGLSVAELFAMNSFRAMASGKALKVPGRRDIITADALGIPPDASWPSRHKDLATVGFPQLL